MFGSYMVSNSTRSRNRQELRRDRVFRWATWLLIGLIGVFLLRPASSSMELFKTDEQRWEFDLQVGNDSHIPTLLLVTEWCSACKSLQYTLDQNQHPYLALDIERNTLARELFDRCIAAGASRSVPKVVHGRQMIAPQKLLLAAQE